MLTQSRLKEAVLYDAETGKFTWLVQQGRVRPGDRAGRVSNNGYIGIQVDGTRYLAHRLAWFYQTGNWPEQQIDHVDRDRANNRFTNLRPANLSQNQGNRPTSRNNLVGVKGVIRVKNNKERPFKAQIKSKSLGYFATADEAGAAYQAAAKQQFGEFAA